MIIVYPVLAYLLGSIPTGYLLGKILRGIDIREHGSGNLGATNVFRVLGKPWGILVLFIDVGKGFAAVMLPLWTSVEIPAQGLLVSLVVISILGHSFPVWLKFKGGKGVATSLGAFLALTPAAVLLALGVFIIVFTISRIISLGSLAAALAFPIAVCVLMKEDAGFGLYLAVSSALCLFIFYTHRKNIGRILRREEKRLF